MSSDNRNRNEAGMNDRRYMMLAMAIAADFGISIAAPVVVFSYVGQRIDAAYGTSPAFVIAGFGVSALLSGFVVYRKAKMYARKFKDLDDKPPPTHPL